MTLNESKSSILGAVQEPMLNMRKNNKQASKFRYKQIEIEKNLTVNEMFDFKNNKLHVKCTFESVRRLYDQDQAQQNKIYELVNNMSAND